MIIPQLKPDHKSPRILIFIWNCFLNSLEIRAGVSLNFGQQTSRCLAQLQPCITEMDMIMYLELPRSKNKVAQSILANGKLKAKPLIHPINKDQHGEIKLIRDL